MADVHYSDFRPLGEFAGPWDRQKIKDDPRGWINALTCVAEDMPEGVALLAAYRAEPPHSERFTRPHPAMATIYFVGPKGGPIKIGFATRLDYRLRDLQLANAYPLECWASIEGPPTLEREYHKRFAAHRLHGEWFERCREIEAEIARLSSSQNDRRGCGV